MYLRQEFVTMIGFRAGYPCKTVDPTIDIKCILSNQNKASEEVPVVAKVDSGFGKGIAINNKLAEVMKVDINKCKTINVSTISGIKEHLLTTFDSISVKFNIRYLKPKAIEDEFAEFAYEATAIPIEIPPDLPDNLVLLGALFMETNSCEMIFNGEGADKTKEKYLVLWIEEKDIKKMIKV